MSDGDKQNPDDFEDEFDFDEEFDESEVEELDMEALDEEAEKITEAPKTAAPKSPMRSPSKSPIPLVVAVLAVSFIGWKGYQWIAGGKTEPNIEELESAAQTATPVEVEESTGLIASMEPVEPAPLLEIEAPKMEPSQEIVSPNTENSNEMAIETGVDTPMTTSSIANVELHAERGEADVSGASWLATESEIFGMDNKITKSEVTFSNVLSKINAQEEAANKRIGVVEENLAELVETVSTMGKNVNQVGMMMDDLNKTIDTLTKEVVALKDETISIRQEQGRAYHTVPHSKGETSAPRDPRDYSNRDENRNFNSAQPNRPRLDIQALGSPKKPDEIKDNAFSAPQVTVHAIIPGRAWLKGKEGRILTVIEGDSIEGYGKVLAIDPHNGWVITSSGIRLK